MTLGDDNIDFTKEQIDAITALCRLSRERFESRRQMEWRASVAVWSVFGAGSGFILAAKDWQPSFYLGVAGCLVALLIVVSYGYWWLPYLTREAQRESRQSYYWETWLQKVSIGRLLPLHLQPETRSGHSETEWPTAFDEDPDNLTGKSGISEKRRIKKGWHEAIRLQLAIAVLFGLLFCGTLLSKCAPPYPIASPKSRVTIEGDSIELNGLSGIKANTELKPSTNPKK